MATPSNPFLALKARIVLLFFFAISISLSLIFGVFGALDLLPIGPDDPIVAPILYVLIFVGLCLAVLLSKRQPPLHLPSLLGQWPAPMNWKSFLLLILGIFLFSLGAFQLSYLALALIAPGLVETTLQQSLMLAADETAYPRLYTGIMMFSVLVVAPIAEEFIFRGILLHRWGVKWGIRPAILLTSMLFGMLHANLVGLFVFGLVMALLYITTRSLLISIVAHGINNAIAFLIESVTLNATTTLPADVLAEFQASWWLGAACLAIATPGAWHYVKQNWPAKQALLPYFANQNCLSNKQNHPLYPERN